MSITGSVPATGPSCSLTLKAACLNTTLEWRARKLCLFEVCWSKTNHGKVTCVVIAYALTGTEGRGYQEAHFLGARTDKRWPAWGYTDDRNQSQDVKLGLLAAIEYSFLNTGLVGPTGVKVQRGDLICQLTMGMAPREPHTTQNLRDRPGSRSPGAALSWRPSSYQLCPVFSGALRLNPGHFVKVLLSLWSTETSWSQTPFLENKRIMLHFAHYFGTPLLMRKGEWILPTLK